MITHEQVLEKTQKYFLHHFPGTHTIVCALWMTNGHVVIGEAHCAEGSDFSTELGAALAKDDAIQKAMSYIAYEKRTEQMKEQHRG